MKKQKPEIVYKVVKPTKSGLRSDQHDFLKRSVSVKYLPKRWTKAKVRGTPLFVFETLEDARHGANHYTHEIWKAEAVNVRDADGRLPATSARPFSAREVQLFWKELELPLSLFPRNPMIDGAVICDKLRLLEKVE